MSASFRRPPLPVWKNSPIKTTGGGIVKVDISAEKNARIAPRGRLVDVGRAVDQKELLKDASSMFDDDEDHVVKDTKASISVDDIKGGELRREDMALLFGSPDTTVIDDDTADESSVNDAKLPATIAAETAKEYTTSSAEDLAAMLKAATLQSRGYQRQRYSSENTTEVAKDMLTKEDMASHVRFLAEFDAEFGGKLQTVGVGSDAQPKSRSDCEAELLRKLESYVRLPAGVVHAMVMKQHEELVQLGLFEFAAEATSD